ncbi:unnamed protein product [Urochloa humidicola]
MNLHATLGNKWSRIARHLPGRNDNEVKNYWNSYLRKKVKTGVQTEHTGDDVPPIKTSYSGVCGSPEPSENDQNHVSHRLLISDSAEPSSVQTDSLPHTQEHCNIMFADWPDSGASPMAPCMGAGAYDVSKQGSLQVGHPCSAVDSMRGLGDGSTCWEFDGIVDHMDIQGGGFWDLPFISESVGYNWQ